MAEVQKNNQQVSGEMTQRFIEFIMMQAQQAALFLGRIPNPQSGKSEPNLDVARMLIDQLEMVREKTRGNLGHEETEILASILSDLQLGYVQASKKLSEPPPTPEPATPEAIVPPPADEPDAATDEENRKRFTKSYGS
jgi:hypothetical protein